ncbi:MAG: DUF3109 family protein [Phycisphaerae bacterium]|nr:DUF3109 family protein [Phycisphaerae bacterium]
MGLDIHTAEIRGVIVHVDALMGLSHCCQPAQCAGKGSCCGAYEVHVAPRELTSIIGLMKEARTLSRRLQDEEVFEEAEDGLVLGSDDDGVCVFAYRSRNGQMLCALHSLALKHGIEPGAVKPKSCLLWPLTLSQGPPRHLSTIDDAFDWPCNGPRPAGATGLDDGVAAIVAAVFGKPFLRDLQDICSQRSYTGQYESDVATPQPADPDGA